MTNHEQGHEPIEAYVQRNLGYIQEAVELISGDPEANPLDVLPSPTEPRDAAEGLALDADQEARLREIANQLGIGGETDIVVPTEVSILEGGKPWKIQAEALLASGQRIIFAGSAHRRIGEDEVVYMHDTHNLDLSGATEYDMARQLAMQQPTFEPYDEERALPFGYSVDADHELVTEETGQLVEIGTIGDKVVQLLRVDRENYEDDAGKSKYRYQPDSATLMRFVSDVLQAEGDEQSGVGLVTSTTYASRAIDTYRAGLSSERFFGVSMYGRQTIADVRGEPVAEPTAINQIPGELHAACRKLLNLQAELA